jgi:hypothetical protein
VEEKSGPSMEQLLTTFMQLQQKQMQEFMNAQFKMMQEFQQRQAEDTQKFLRDLLKK